MESKSFKGYSTIYFCGNGLFRCSFEFKGHGSISDFNRVISALKIFPKNRKILIICRLLFNGQTVESVDDELFYFNPRTLKFSKYND